MKTAWRLGIVAASGFLAVAAWAEEITTTGREPYRGELVLVTGTVRLPGPGWWAADEGVTDGDLRLPVAWPQMDREADEDGMSKVPVAKPSMA